MNLTLLASLQQYYVNIVLLRAEPCCVLLVQTIYYHRHMQIHDFVL